MYKENLIKVHQKIKPYIHNTPVLSSKLLNEIVGAKLYFKCENFQKSGSFKFRAATNAVLKLDSSQKQNGVITHSSGNFAQALSLASQAQNITAHIVMPKNAPEFKKRAVLQCNNNLVECQSTIMDREKISKKIQDKYDLTFIHPSNNLNVILGNSTVVSELLDDHTDLDYIICPIGGGGLISGSALACEAYSSRCEVIGAEPTNVNDAYRSLQSKQIEYNSTTDTLADGLRTNLGDINFPIILNYINTIICIDEIEIINAMKLVYDKLDMLIEPSSAVTFAAVLKEKEKFKGKKIGVIISGGNVENNNLPF